MACRSPCGNGALTDPAELLERHLCREFIISYVRQSLARSRTAAIDPNRLYMALRLSGLKVSIKTMESVLMELQKQA